MRNLFAKTLMLLLFSVSAHTGFSQVRDSIPKFDIFERLSAKKTGEGDVKIIANSRLETVMHSRFTNREVLRGWRIRIYRSNKQDARSTAERIRGNVSSIYPKLPTYVTYENPYFYVAVGDFYTKESAEKTRREMSTIYPSSSLIESKINFPKYE